jgi:hypothetical protein
MRVKTRSLQARGCRSAFFDDVLAAGGRLCLLCSRGERLLDAAHEELAVRAPRGLTDNLTEARLKQGKSLFGKDYFDELLERIREIRASERRFYQKVTDIYALAVDYDTAAPVTREFFATVQNKLHWAITGQTAAELIYSSADATKLYMGLSTWKDAPRGKILKSDVTVAKNYLGEAHVNELNRIVSAYLELAENRAQRGILMKMADWAIFLNGFLELSSYPILADKGKVSALEAKLKAEGEYEIYRRHQDAEYVSDFDRVVEETRRLEGGGVPKSVGAGRPKKHALATPDTAPSKGKRKP